jgi:hypothetical protein
MHPCRRSLSARTVDCVRRGKGRAREGGGEKGRNECVRADAGVRSRGYARVRANASVLPPGNFVADATVRPSHGRPSGHRPTVRPSAIVRVTTLPSMKQFMTLTNSSTTFCTLYHVRMAVIIFHS